MTPSLLVFVFVIFQKFQLNETVEEVLMKLDEFARLADTVGYF